MAKSQKFFNILGLIFGGLLLLTTSISVKLWIDIDNEEIKEQVCNFYFGNTAHALSFIKTTDRYLPEDKWITALAVIEVESDFQQYAFSTVSKTIWERGKRKIVRVVLCRGYYALDQDTFRSICGKYRIHFENYWDIYDGANNILIGTIHLRDCFQAYGKQLGLEIYNVGSGNYYNRGWRNQDYIDKVLVQEKKVKEWIKIFKQQNRRKSK